MVEYHLSPIVRKLVYVSSKHIHINVKVRLMFSLLACEQTDKKGATTDSVHAQITVCTVSVINRVIILNYT